MLAAPHLRTSMRHAPTFRRTDLMLVGSLAILAVGCNRDQEATLDEPSARSALLTFLDSWQAGHTASDLPQDAASITVSDPDWSAGATLVSYQLAGDLINDGSHLETLVDLTLRRSGGEVVVRARYRISTEPTISIDRTDVPAQTSNPSDATGA
jgi:hypothetical protein